jgi:hypothetical protein
MAPRCCVSSAATVLAGEAGARPRKANRAAAKMAPIKAISGNRRLMLKVAFKYDHYVRPLGKPQVGWNGSPANLMFPRT